MVDNLPRSTEYFAAKKTSELCPALMDKVEGYFKFLQASGRMAVWRRSYEFYYRGMTRGARINKGGAENELSLINVNHYRNLLQHLKNMTTQQLPALNPRAANTDYESMAQTIVASGILDYYLNERDMATFACKAVELCLLFAEGEIAQTWDPLQGDDYAADKSTGQVYKTGDVAMRVYAPMDVVRDWLQADSDHHVWKITRDFRNKYDLAAKYPTFAGQILDKSIDDTKAFNFRLGYTGRNETDLIPVFTFYHERTASVPAGRMVEFLDSETALFDGPLPYDGIPLYRISASEHAGTPFGYTVGYDLLMLQEAIDGIVSTILTNQSQYGVQNIWSPAGNGLSVTQLAGGLNLITSKIKPEGLNLTNTPAEIFKFLEMIVAMMETLSGVNSVARGNPEASLKSGAALALVQSMAIQFNSGLQQSYAKLWGDLGTGLISLLKKFPTTKRNIVIAGKNNRSYMATFERDTLKNIKRVVVDLGNPLSRTTAGKVDMADNLLQRGLIKEPEQYIEVLTTGKLEPTFEGPQAEKMLVRAENEKLMNGEPVQALATDPHALHIQEHKVVLASPESRMNPQAVGNTLSHMQEHINLLRTTDPALLLAIGQQPIAAPVPPSPAPPQAGAATPQPAAGGPGPGAQMDPTPPGQQAGEAVQPAKMPKNALTGERYDPISGGLK